MYVFSLVDDYWGRPHAVVRRVDMLNTRQARVDMDAGGKAASTTVEDTLFVRGGKNEF
jgi:hypothetical protein